jgi:hypothetical protein
MKMLLVGLCFDLRVGFTWIFIVLECEDDSKEIMSSYEERLYMNGWGIFPLISYIFENNNMVIIDNKL